MNGCLAKRSRLIMIEEETFFTQYFWELLRFVPATIPTIVTVILAVIRKKEEKPKNYNSVRNILLSILGAITMVLAVWYYVEDKRREYAWPITWFYFAAALFVFCSLLYGFAVSELIWLRKIKNPKSKKRTITKIVCIIIVTFPIWFNIAVAIFDEIKWKNFDGAGEWISIEEAMKEC